MSTDRVILVTGFEAFGTHKSNPSEEVARTLDGRSLGGASVRALVLPVDQREASPVVASAGTRPRVAPGAAHRIEPARSS